MIPDAHGMHPPHTGCLMAVREWGSTAPVPGHVAAYVPGPL